MCHSSKSAAASSVAGFGLSLFLYSLFIFLPSSLSLPFLSLSLTLALSLSLSLCLSLSVSLSLCLSLKCLKLAVQITDERADRLCVVSVCFYVLLDNCHTGATQIHAWEDPKPVCPATTQSGLTHPRYVVFLWVPTPYMGSYANRHPGIIIMSSVKQWTLLH